MNLDASAGLRRLLTPTRRRALRDGAILAGLIFNFTVLFVWGPRLLLWADAQSWYTIDLANLYDRAEESLLAVGAFRLAPVFAWLLYPSTWLPYPVFIAIYVALSLLAVAVLVRWWTPIFVVAFPPVLLEVLNGNIHIFLALAIWAGMRWPAAWSVLLLTKVTPGVGIVWFAAREEWRDLGIALGATVAIIVVGALVVPSQWLEWVWSLIVSAEGPQVGDLPPLYLRLPAAALLIAFAARRDQAWLVPVGCLIAMPTIWIQSSAYLLACFPLYWQRDRWKRAPRRLEPVHMAGAT